MNIVKYKPTDVSLFDWDTVLDRFFEDPVFDTNIPAVDLKEENDKFLMEVELPGLTEKDIELKIEGNLLTISSKKDTEKNEKRDGYIIKERRHTSFTRSFTLPNSIDRDKIEAEFKNGLLTITFPKHESKKPKLISIKNKN